MWQSKQITPDQAWSPFRVSNEKTSLTRGMNSLDGVGDRLRLVAFAELQAREAFLWGAQKFKGQAPDAWIERWVEFATVEDRHAQMLLTRMAELGVQPGAKPVSDKLSRLCRASEDPITFLFVLASAEERGMEAGSILGKQMAEYDPISAAVFAQIANEEVEHVEMSRMALEGYDLEDLKARARAVNALL